MKQPIVNAGVLMERFIKNGQYSKLKSAENQTKISKKYLREKLSEDERKRFEFEKFGMVARFVPKYIYEWDHIGLVNYLSDYFDLSVLVKHNVIDLDIKTFNSELDDEDFFSDFELPPTYYVKPSFNKDGRALIQATNNVISTHNDISEAVEMIAKARVVEHHLKNEYENLKRQMFACPLLHEKRKIKHEFGSVSLVKNKPKFDLVGILNAIDEINLYQYLKVNPTALQEFAAKGYISSMSEILQFRVVKDVRMDFIVTTFEAEQRMFEGMLRRKEIVQQQSIRSRAN